MKKLKKQLSLGLLCLASGLVLGQSPNAPFLEKFMKENGLQGTMVVERLGEGMQHIYNETRAGVRYLPASTFKIVNTLIALTEGAVASESELVAWDGVDRGYSQWNQDQSILTAFPNSCVWFFQALARRVGLEKYRDNLKRMGYGNGQTGEGVDTFWLDGALQISALEQVEVMKNIYLEKYPFSHHSYEVLKRVMIVRQTGASTVRAKTGWAMRREPHIGWYVGYVEAADGVWLFACNLDIREPKEAEFREKMAYRAFAELGILK